MYKNALVLGPMVRISTLPLRLLALRYGADLVYTDEIVDIGLLKARKIDNDELGTLDFIGRNGKIIFRTCSEEKSKVVLQLGTSEPERAVQTAKLVEDHVSAVDVNMGCPQYFSINYGMGAALMKEPEKARDILTALVENLKVPVTCKIRVFATPEKTLDFVNHLIPSGISAIAIHGRTITGRPKHPDRPEIIKYISERVSIPVIANGASQRIKKYEDIQMFKEESGCSSVMLSRAAQRNCSIFRPEGCLPMDEVITEYLKLAIRYNYESNCKYVLMNMLGSLMAFSDRGIKLTKCKTFEAICELWDLGELCRETKQSRPADYYVNLYTDLGREEDLPTLDSGEITHMPVAFKVKEVKGRLPKTKLEAWTRKNDLDLPEYKIINSGECYRALLLVNGDYYTSSVWETNKLFAEQAAAVVCLKTLHVP